MKVIEKSGGTNVEPRAVYAVLKRRRLCREETLFLLQKPSGFLMWENAKDYAVADPKLPADWIYVCNGKNRRAKSSNPFDGDGPVDFSDYMGPALLMNPVANLVKLSNGDAALSKALSGGCEGT